MQKICHKEKGEKRAKRGELSRAAGMRIWCCAKLNSGQQEIPEQKAYMNEACCTFINLFWVF